MGKSVRRAGRLGLGALTVMGMLVVAACGGTHEEANMEDLTLVLRNDPDSFDPAVTAADTGATQIHEALYDTLIRRDYETGEFQSAMAADWDVTPTKIDFTLKEGLACADGTELTATDVKNSIERLGDPETGSIYTGRVFGSGGLQEVVADDEANTLSVEVGDPHTDLLEGLRNAFIVCPSGLADEEALVTEPQGSGPYELVGRSGGDTYILERWDSPAVDNIEELPEKITMRVVTSDATRANMFDTGEADIVSILGRDSERLEDVAEPIRAGGFQADTLVFNQRNGEPGADQNVREAVAHALDSQDYTQAASYGVGLPAETIYTENMAGIGCFTEENETLKPQQDLDQARTKLAEAGYGPGDETLTLTLVGYDEQNSGPDYIADALREIGIEVEVDNGTQAQAAGLVYEDTGDWDIIVFPMQSASPIPYPVVTKMSSVLGEGGSYNFGRVTNPEFDELAEQAPGLEGEERCNAWAAAEAALLERIDAVPLMQPVANYYGNGLSFDATQRTVDLRTIAPTD